MHSCKAPQQNLNHPQNKISKHTKSYLDLPFLSFLFFIFSRKMKVTELLFHLEQRNIFFMWWKKKTQNTAKEDDFLKNAFSIPVTACNGSCAAQRGSVLCTGEGFTTLREMHQSPSAGDAPLAGISTHWCSSLGSWGRQHWAHPWLEGH